jgi:AraC family transcriptional regulator, regulatory protein of adaptative response / methylated-DNA-[protein]-cysteine methyltransferase
MTPADMRIEPNAPAKMGIGSAANERIQFGIGSCWLGAILVAATDSGICAILIGDDPAVLQRDLQDRFPDAQLTQGGEALDTLTARVIAFVEAPDRNFDVPLDPQGTAFERRVWRALREIPAGSTVTYSDIAARIGAPKEAYAIGEACAANMIAVAIPCHRVVRKNGSLAGYRWGVKRKRALLKREAGQ